MNDYMPEAERSPPAVSASPAMSVATPGPSIPLPGQASGMAPVVTPSAQATVDASAAAPRIVGLAAILEQMRRGFRHETGAAQLKIDGKSVFLVDFSTQHVWHLVAETVDDRKLGERMLQGSEAMEMTRCHLTPEILGRLSSRMQSLACMVWDACLAVRHADARSPLNALSEVRLLRWPTFQLLVQRHDHFRLCSLLLRKACTVSECAETLQLEEADVLDFMRAAYFTGYADIVGTRQEQQSTARLRRNNSSRLVGWWRNMRNPQQAGVPT